MQKLAIPHKHFVNACKEFQNAIENHRPGRLIGVCGLAGGGKTFLRNQEVRAVVGDPEAWGTGKLIAVEVMALLDFNSKFSPKGFAARAHRALMLPDLRWLYRDTSEEIEQAYLESLVSAHEVWEHTKIRNRFSESELWLSFGEAAVARGIKYILVEHAHAFGSARFGEEPTDHIQNLMSVAETIGAMVVLNFVPAGYRLWAGKPEIADRMDRVYIQPYDPLSQEQMNDFGLLLTGVADGYSFTSRDVYRDLAIEIAISTATCTRSIEQLFKKATVEAMRNGREKISSKDLIASFETKEHVEAVWRQVRLLSEISRPAKPNELREIHASFLGRAHE